jgi:outer membrane protein insertion porin family
VPERVGRNVRVALFADAGQAWYVGDTRFYDREGFRTLYRFDLDDVRVSTGLAVEWLAPLGLFRFSFGVPLRFQRETDRRYGDEIERFQFSIGSAF